MQKCHSIIVTGKVQDIEGIKEQVLPFDIDLPYEFSKVSSDDEIDVGINNLNVKFDAFSSRLERILEKLTER